MSIPKLLLDIRIFWAWVLWNIHLGALHLAVAFGLLIGLALIYSPLAAVMGAFACRFAISAIERVQRPD
jgi:hypothetical protein